MNIHIARDMYKLFKGRTDTYAIQRQKGDSIVYYRVTGKELTLDTILEHLRGHIVLGLYPLLENNTCHFACIDIDEPNLKLAQEVRMFLPRPNYIECSRSGNYHIWMFFKEAVATTQLLEVCKAALDYAKSQTKAHCNLYPLPSVKSSSVGVLIALPLQGKELDKERTVFIDDAGKQQRHNFLRGIKYCKLELKRQKQKLTYATALNNPVVRSLYMGVGKVEGDQSQSGYDFSFCKLLLEGDLTDEEAKRLLVQRVGVKSTDDSYLERTVKAARIIIGKQKSVKKQTTRQATRQPTEQEVEQETKTYGWDDIPIVERKEFYRELKDLLIFEDVQRSQMDIFLAAVIANLKTKGRPVWLLIVGPPGCGKTMGMLALANSPFVHTVSAMKPAALISGWGLKGSEDMSLIPKLDGKILMVKDMSSLLSQNKDVVAEVLGLLRDAYDGCCSRPFGTGVIRSYTSRFGFIGATTPDIDANWTLNVRLGERFLRWRVRTPLDQVYAKIDKSLDGLFSEVEIETRLEELCLGHLRFLLEQGDLPKLNDARKIGRLAQLGAILRTAVARGSHSTNVLVVPVWEEATRYAKQLAKMAVSLAYVRGKETNDDVEFEDLKALVRDGLDGRIEKILGLLYYQPGIKTLELAQATGLPTWTIRSCLGDLEVARIVRPQRTSHEMSWYFVPHIAEQCKVFKLWEKKGKV